MEPNGGTVGSAVCMRVNVKRVRVCCYFEKLEHRFHTIENLKFKPVIVHPTSPQILSRSDTIDVILIFALSFYYPAHLLTYCTQ